MLDGRRARILRQLPSAQQYNVSYTTTTSRRDLPADRWTDYIIIGIERAKSLFHHFSRQPVAGISKVRKGYLQFPQAAGLIRALIPGLSDREVRFGMAHICSMDVNGDGLVSFGEFLRGLQATSLQLPGGTISAGFRKPSGTTGAGKDDYEYDHEISLDNFHHKGQAYLIDSETRVLYQLQETEEGNDEAWPAEVGFVKPSGEVRFTSATDHGAKKLAAFYQEITSFMEVMRADTPIR
eukprot:scaffold91105_cov22-Prasinocladus_malaysianus.AAC.1